MAYPLDLLCCAFLFQLTLSFCFKNINVSELSDTLAQIKTKKSLGIDGISIKLLKAAGDIILDSLGTIFNLSLQTGIYPDHLMTGNWLKYHQSLRMV